MRIWLLAYAAFSPLLEKVRTLTGLETTENPSLLEPGRRPLQIKDRAASWPHARGRRDSGVLRCVSHGAIGPRPVLLGPGAAGCVRAAVAGVPAVRSVVPERVGHGTQGRKVGSRSHLYA